MTTAALDIAAAVLSQLDADSPCPSAPTGARQLSEVNAGEGDGEIFIILCVVSTLHTRLLAQTAVAPISAPIRTVTSSYNQRRLHTIRGTLHNRTLLHYTLLSPPPHPVVVLEHRAAPIDQLQELRTAVHAPPLALRQPGEHAVAATAVAAALVPHLLHSLRLLRTNGALVHVLR